MQGWEATGAEGSCGEDGRCSSGEICVRPSGFKGKFFTVTFYLILVFLGPNFCLARPFYERGIRNGCSYPILPWILVLILLILLLSIVAWFCYRAYRASRSSESEAA